MPAGFHRRLQVLAAALHPYVYLMALGQRVGKLRPSAQVAHLGAVGRQALRNGLRVELGTVMAMVPQVDAHPAVLIGGMAQSVVVAAVAYGGIEPKRRTELVRVEQAAQQVVPAVARLAALSVVYIALCVALCFTVGQEAQVLVIAVVLAGLQRRGIVHVVPHVEHGGEPCIL